jgi:UDP:flavonoid glycosyltransferase YjiC (YdhE family)
MMLDDPAGLDPELEAFLGAGEPPISIGFGSMGDHDPRRTTRALIEALDGRRAVLLSGWAGLGDAALPSHVFLARSAPHARLLPRVAIAIHHGGAGTTAAAARAGVPQIVVPHVADQFYWGRQVWRLGLGSAPLRRDHLTAAALKGAIEFVGAHPEIAARARHVGAQLQRSDGADRAAELLDRAISEDREERFAA